MWWALLAGALSVSVSVQADLPQKGCAWSALIPRSLQDLDSLQVVGTASVAVQVKVQDGELQVRLTETGEVLSRRSLPADTACEARADGVALFVEQQLQQLGYVPPEPQLPPLKAATATVAPALGLAPTLEPPPAPAPAPAAVSSARVATSKEAWQLWGALAGMAQGPAALDYRAGGAAEISLGPAEWSGFFNVGGWAPRQTELTRNAVVVGTLRTWAVSMSVGGQWCPALGPGRVCARGRAGLEFVRGSTEGDLLFGEGSALKAAPIVGLGARYVLPLGEVFAVWLSVEGLLRPRPAAFVVEDSRSAEDPVLGVVGGLGLSVRFF